MKFTFKSKFVGFGSPETTMEFEVDHIDDVINYFEHFLKGCGYVFDGHLDIVYDDESTGGLYNYDNFEKPTQAELDEFSNNMMSENINVSETDGYIQTNN